tara:strand:+ start:248 stop:439 length:192 start_codon:yes stop_codon:yes gene_type:complete
VAHKAKLNISSKERQKKKREESLRDLTTWLRERNKDKDKYQLSQVLTDRLSNLKNRMKSDALN